MVLAANPCCCANVSVMIFLVSVTACQIQNEICERARGAPHEHKLQANDFMGSTLGFVKMQCPQLADAQTQGRCIACFQHPDASGTFLAWAATRLGSLSVSHNKLALNHLPVRSKQIEFSFVVPIIRDTRKLHKLI